MKTALALGGGGTKGSYELGVLKALKELNITPEIVTGTSIGSVTGALYCQNNIDHLEEIWSNISINQIFRNDTQFMIENLPTDNEKLVAFFKTHLNKPTTDITPFKNTVTTLIDEDKVRNSNIDFGLVCVLFPSMKPLELSLSDIPYGYLHDYLIASCAVFPAFPMHKIDDKLHLDGGYYDNLPINLAINMGADYVIAVDLFFKPNHPEYQNSPLVKYIKTSWSLSPILSFNQKSIDKNIALGYNDTLKAFDRLLGFRYSFTTESLQNMEYLYDNFAKNILMFESKIPFERRVMKKIVSHPLSAVIKEYTTEKLTKPQFFIRGLEILMELINFDPAKIYSIDELNRELISRFFDKERYEYKELFKTILPTNASIRAGIDKEYLVGCILYKLISLNEPNFTIFWLATLFPKETTAAFYLYSLIKQDLEK